MIRRTADASRGVWHTAGESPVVATSDMTAPRKNHGGTRGGKADSDPGARLGSRQIAKVTIGVIDIRDAIDHAVIYPKFLIGGREHSEAGLRFRIGTGRHVLRRYWSRDIESCEPVQARQRSRTIALVQGETSIQGLMTSTTFCGGVRTTVVM